jgi:formylmethanofuran dehydrogenase subunit B
MVDGAKSFFREHSAILLALGAQFVAVGAAAASLLAYMVKLETRVSIMEERGAAYTVSRMDEMKLKINSLEKQIENNEDTIKRIIDVMTRELNKPVPR